MTIESMYFRLNLLLHRIRENNGVTPRYRQSCLDKVMGWKTEYEGASPARKVDILNTANSFYQQFKEIS